jgi:hypothetical protein
MFRQRLTVHNSFFNAFLRNALLHVCGVVDRDWPSFKLDLDLTVNPKIRN